ncbi:MULTISPECIES: tetratricopeptide repeat protein [unclassified Thioalkalivibrio]|uniref:YfgM family protein n=1 Tax=unclassified Thioalkalivibrio TaxID=2621013 RepID=UPI0003774E0F|nr:MULTISPECIES: tetratricopeptide repeat protein [unclassified Thioalkalivibrio]
MSYLTDEEKAERIKQWWSDNGMAVIAGLVLGIAGLFGYNWWSGQQAERAEQASEMYQALQFSMRAGQYEQADEMARQLIEHGGRTPYVALAWAHRAEVALAGGEQEAAVAALREAVDAAPDDGHRALFRLRLVRQLIRTEALDEAASVLATVEHDAFRGLRLELDGDLARARGDHDTARERYREALDAGHSPEYLQLKFEDLSA